MNTPDIRRTGVFETGRFVRVAEPRVTMGVMTARGRVVLPFQQGSLQAWPDLALFKFLARRDLRRDALFG